MNKCLSLVHLTSRIGPQSSGSDESASWFLRFPTPDVNPPGTKSVSGRLTRIAAAPCSALRLNSRAGNLPRTPELRLPTSPFLASQRTLMVRWPQVRFPVPIRWNFLQPDFLALKSFELPRLGNCSATYVIS